ncbi:MAG: hypothetical protein HY738_16030, partial [Bacteroidia bacterium]|nr:hypothetical protein [Bacteroidia bacterium]
MNNICVFLLAILLVLTISGFKAVKFFSQDEKDWNECIEKYDSKWGTPCSNCGVYNDSFKIFVKNVCNEPVDVQVAVQNTNKKWQVYYKGNFAPKDTMSVWACKGTGKWLYWTRKAG